MDLLEKKINILANAAKYDVSCSSSGSNRKNTTTGTGNAAVAGICHSWSDDGRCISLLKILMSNFCIYDCDYCVNRASNDIPRATFTEQEIVDITMNFYRRNYIEGLFLSSGIVKSPDETMMRFITIARKLRKEHQYNGYLHMKAIPGCSSLLLDELAGYVDRMSINIELPTEKSLQLLAPQKKTEEIINPMRHIRNMILQNKEDVRKFQNISRLLPAGQTTQMIIGATGEDDRTILRLSQNLYQRMNLKRVYYSAYIPVSGSRHLTHIDSVPLLREHRLYQADWLLRFYQFQAEEILTEQDPFFNIDLDPKANWALRNWSKFPIEINRASYHQLLRIPGIGVISAKRIIKARKFGMIHWDQLKGFGVVMKRAKYFLTCDGHYERGLILKPEEIQLALTNTSNCAAARPVQLTLWERTCL